MKNKDSCDVVSNVTRRDFVKISSMVAALPLVGFKFSHAAGQPAVTPSELSSPAVNVVPTCSTFDCGGKCDIRAHVQDGAVIQITTRPDAELDPAMPVMRACVRGRSYRKFVYHPDRLKYPMKRVGKRGEGKFERISWDEATTLIADNLQRITEKYGPSSRYVHVGTAVSGGTSSYGGLPLAQLQWCTPGTVRSPGSLYTPRPTARSKLRQFRSPGAGSA